MPYTLGSINGLMLFCHIHSMWKVSSFVPYVNACLCSVIDKRLEKPLRAG